MHMAPPCACTWPLSVHAYGPSLCMHMAPPPACLLCSMHGHAAILAAPPLLVLPLPHTPHPSTLHLTASAVPCTAAGMWLPAVAVAASRACRLSHVFTGAISRVHRCHEHQLLRYFTHGSGIWPESRFVEPWSRRFIHPSRIQVCRTRIQDPGVPDPDPGSRIQVCRTLAMPWP